MSECIVRSAGEADAGEWDAFVRSHERSSGYHLWAWRRVFEDVFGHECAYLQARNGNRIVGVLPLVKFRSWLFGRSLVSLPFVNYGGVVAVDAVAADALLGAACGLARTWRARHVELRHAGRQFSQLPCRTHKVVMRLRLADPETLWRALDRKVRNQVRKSQQSGLTAADGGVELIPDFYDVFARNMRDLGTPVYSCRLFERVLRQFPESATVFVVRSGGRCVAGAIAYEFRDTIEVPWASSLREFRALCPNMLMYWTMIRWAADKRAVWFDFGRSTPHEGTYLFKKQWGAVPEDLCWEYGALGDRPVPDQSPANPTFAPAIRAWKRVPVSIATRLGPLIVRNIA
jgi:serine/alanine adding enzyme